MCRVVWPARAAADFSICGHGATAVAPDDIAHGRAHFVFARFEAAGNHLEIAINNAAAGMAMCGDNALVVCCISDAA